MPWTENVPTVGGPYWVRFNRPDGTRSKPYLCSVSLCGDHAWGAPCSQCSLAYFGTENDDYIDATDFAGTEWCPVEPPPP